MGLGGFTPDQKQEGIVGVLYLIIYTPFYLGSFTLYSIFIFELNSLLYKFNIKLKYLAVSIYSFCVTNVFPTKKHQT